MDALTYADVNIERVLADAAVEEREDDAIVSLGRGLVPAGYLKQGLQAGRRRRAALRRLLEHRRLPEDGWDDVTIEGVMYDLAMMDR